MSPTPRQRALKGIQSTASPGAPAAAAHVPLTELFGSKVFNDDVQRRRLQRSAYRALRQTIESVEHGATHYTHWFQPMTGLTAEKHDSFLSPIVEGGAIHSFTGKELIRGEPDASSFPSGGARTTFEARGYTAWDPTSPAFLKESAYGTTLCIPTAFCSWNGEALDTKTPLLRSAEVLDRQARRLLGLIGEGHINHVACTVGPEQEYFLVDRSLFYTRPDLVNCDRTLMGARPPKGQELEDHYFSTTPERVLNFMKDLERELWQLGVPVKTRHNEVAPHQFEMAPMFETVSIAIDHNMLAMELLQTVAERHGLKCLLHEKPFAGVNGSGKHNNWSMMDDEGSNLLDPGHSPHDNLRFMLFLTAIIRAVDEHQDLIRASVATAGNDHRLGANEAPPAIISIFLGSELEEIVEGLIAGTTPQAREREHLQLGVTALPPLPKDTTDRNRTSPFAFTGNKFELRACGSSQTLAYPNTVINTSVAEALDHLATEIERRADGGDVNAVVQDVVRETLTAHQRILFSGDNYSAEWEEEAKKRGLLNMKDTPTALARFTAPENVELFERYGVMTKRETESRSTVFFEGYVHRVRVEALTTVEMAATMVLPAAIAFQGRLAASIRSAREASKSIDLGDQEDLLAEVAGAIAALKRSNDTLRRLQIECDEQNGDPVAGADRYRDQVLPAMSAVREHADHLESIVENDDWPLAKYRELLFYH
jgi:glutamine synthetase